MNRRGALCVLAMACLTTIVRAQDGGRWPPKDQFPQTPGTHHLAIDITYQGKTRTHTYGIYLPPNVDAGKKLPMLVYLVGLGERGNDPTQLFMVSPLSEMERHARLKDWVDFAILIPQCPRDTRYENPEMGNMVAEVTRHAIAHWPIDPDRVHLTGMSMGGEGVWHAALAGPELFATVTAMGGRAHPDPDKVAKALKDTTVWVIVGDRDGEFTAGSKQMVEALRNEHADVVHTILPGYSHNIWRPLMSKRQFYEWILLHSRDQAAPPERPMGEKLSEIPFLPPEDELEANFTRQTQEAFEKWLPYWHLDNCGRKGGVGHHQQFGSAKDVFITYPLSPMTPCRLAYTTTPPARRKSTLMLTVGRHPAGDWRLEVRLNNKTVLDQKIERQPDGELYQSFEVDLSDYAGKELSIQLLNHATGWEHEHAVWDRVEIVTE